MAAEPEELGEEKKKKAKKPTDRLGFPRKIIAACVLAPRRAVRVSLLGHHFFAGWPLLLLLEAGRRPSHRKASVPQFLNDVPEYIQFQKFEFGVYSELSVIESIHPTTPPRSFSKLSISLAFRCHPRFCLLGKQEIQRQSSFNAFPSKFCFILFGPSERVLRKKRNCAHHRCCCLGWCCWKGLWVINTTALRSGWKIPSLDTNTSAGLTNTMSSTFYSPSPCFVTLNVLLLLFLRLLRHIQCSSLLLDGHPSIHPPSSQHNTCRL